MSSTEFDASNTRQAFAARRGGPSDLIRADRLPDPKSRSHPPSEQQRLIEPKRLFSSETHSAGLHFCRSTRHWPHFLHWHFISSTWLKSGSFGSGIVRFDSFSESVHLHLGHMPGFRSPAAYSRFFEPGRRPGPAGADSDSGVSADGCDSAGVDSARASPFSVTSAADAETGVCSGSVSDRTELTRRPSCGRDLLMSWNLS